MLVQTRRHGNVAVILLNNPREHNVLSDRLVTDMHEALGSVEVESARAVVVGGVGQSFCAGANIRDLLECGWMEGRNQASNPVSLFRRLIEDPRPVVGAIGGQAIGGGFELALSCDLLVASQHASFMLPEAKHGVIPNTGLALLAQAVGKRRAMEYMTTLKKMSAQEALGLGLVNALVEPEAVLERAIEMANTIITACAPGALVEIKRTLARNAAVDWHEVETSLTRLPSAQWQEGLTAFLERRQPDYESFWSQNA